MDQLLCLFLLVELGLHCLPALADDIIAGHPVGDFNALPKITESEQPGQVKKKTNKVIGKIVRSHAKIKKRDPKTVGDFGPLQTNPYKINSHSGSDAVPPHPSDFQSVPVESGPDTRRAK
jgi:hypothetical protein